MMSKTNWLILWEVTCHERMNECNYQDAATAAAVVMAACIIMSCTRIRQNTWPEVNVRRCSLVFKSRNFGVRSASFSKPILCHHKASVLAVSYPIKAEVEYDSLRTQCDHLLSQTKHESNCIKVCVLTCVCLTWLNAFFAYCISVARSGVNFDWKKYLLKGEFK